MAKILNFPSNQLVQVVSSGVVEVFDLAAVEERISPIPIVKQAVFFLKRASDENGIKQTEKGFLGRNFVQAFWDEHLSTPEDIRFRPTRESDCPEVTRIHSLLAESKYVRKFKGAIQLTPKGRKAVDNVSYCEIYRDLFETGMLRWNWGYDDRYPDFDFIQGSAPHLIARLKAWPTSSLTAKEFFESVFGEKKVKAPQSLSEEVSSESYFDLEEQMIRCFYIRFFERFCVPFGILRDLSERRLFGKPTDPFEKSEFFVTDFSKVLSGG